MISSLDDITTAFVIDNPMCVSLAKSQKFQFDIKSIASGPAGKVFVGQNSDWIVEI